MAATPEQGADASWQTAVPQAPEPTLQPRVTVLGPGETPETAQQSVAAESAAPPAGEAGGGLQYPQSAVQVVASGENEKHMDYFDWVAENDVAEENKYDTNSKSVNTQSMTFKNAPIFLVTTFFGNIILVGLMLVPILVTHYQFKNKHRDDPHDVYVADNVEAWFIWAAFNLFFQWWIHIAIEVLPQVVLGLIRLVWGPPPQVALSRAEQFGMFKLYIKLVLYAALNWGSWTIIFDSFYALYSEKRPSELSKGWYLYRIYQVMEFIFFITLTVAAEKIIVRAISIHFHQSAYADRIEAVSFALRTFDTLYDRRPRKQTPGNSPGPRSFQAAAGASARYLLGSSGSRPQTPAEGVPKPEKKTRLRRMGNMARDQFKAGSAYAAKLASIGMRDPSYLMRSEEMGLNLDLSSPAMAKRLARQLFEGYRSDPTRRYLVPEDFATAFPNSPTEAHAAFAVFDVDGNGDISQSEIKNTVMQTYKERRTLTHAMQDLNHAVGQLDYVLLIIASIFVLFEALAIFDVNVKQSIATFYTMGIAFAFVFKESAQNVFDSIIFIFVTHPFDTGDLIVLNDDIVTVKRLSLLSSEFVRVDNTDLFVSNAVLSSMKIVNYRRSRHQYEETHIQVAFDTPLSKLDAVEADINYWIENDSEHRFLYPSRIVPQTISYMRVIDCTVGMTHAHNFQDWGERLHRQTAFFSALSYYLRKHGVMYEHGLETAHMFNEDWLAQVEAQRQAALSSDSATAASKLPEEPLPYKMSASADDAQRAAGDSHVDLAHRAPVQHVQLEPDPSFDEEETQEGYPFPSTQPRTTYMFFRPPPQEVEHRRLRRRRAYGQEGAGGG